ncbi:hypothetical protein HHI36_005593 [Cryptolaemus montrouzieri]|uniref:Uncharacterized protein n=1 Tax=Cryptolaemus montrouzieri TaxID=559131 RepID=A0ABD2NUL4_9CUCU
MEYVRGKDNVTANALSRIEISSSELKGMNAKIKLSAYAAPRGQAEKKLEQSKGDAKVALNDAGLDHPGIVQLLKPPVNSVELQTVFDNLLGSGMNTRKEWIRGNTWNFNEKRKVPHKKAITARALEDKMRFWSENLTLRAQSAAKNKKMRELYEISKKKQEDERTL